MMVDGGLDRERPKTHRREELQKVRDEKKELLKQLAELEEKEKKVFSASYHRICSRPWTFGVSSIRPELTAKGS